MDQQGKFNTSPKTKIRDMMQEIGKLPPQATDLEDIIVGAILSDSTAFIFVNDILTSKHMYSAYNELIYASFERLASEGDPIDLMTVVEDLKKHGNLEKAGGAYRLTGLMDRVVSSVNIEHHARIILQKHMQREMIKLCQITINDCYDDTVDIFEIIENYEEARDELINQVITKRETFNLDVSKDVMKNIEENMNKSDKEISGIPSGLTDIDRTTGGWQKGAFHILAARPAMGKTAMMLSFVLGAAEQGVPVAVFSLEMSNNSLYTRMLSKLSQVNIELIIKNKLSPEDWEAIKHADKKLKNLPIYWDDKAGSTLTEIQAKSKRMKRLYNIEMVVVDYLQLVTGSQRGNREQEIGSISRGLKVLAKDLDLPVIALSQLSRAVESRPGNNKRPMLSDLRESGSLEQDADCVMFLYRPEYYDITENEMGESTAGLAEVIFAKNRNGATDTIELNFAGKFMHFGDIEDGFFYHDGQPSNGFHDASSVVNMSNLNNFANNSPDFDLF